MNTKELNSIALPDLLTIAQKAYDDASGLGASADWTSVVEDGRLTNKGVLGDTLAEFLIIELCETYVPDVHREIQLTEACRVIANAANILNSVYEFFSKFENPAWRPK